MNGPDLPTTPDVPEPSGVDEIDGATSTDAAPGGTSRPIEHVALWTAMHGFVMLEINHHLPFVEDRERAFDVALRRWLAVLD